MVGDGHTMVRHCEFVEVAFDVEPDAGPIYCENEIDPETNQSTEGEQLRHVQTVEAGLGRKAPGA